jgi:hypothetical protein
MAVVQVVLNRVRHPAYPKTVCGVVFQGHERQTGCQFSYTCDGSLVRQPSADAWQRFRGIGRAMLGGQIYAPVGSATHYHTDWVLPKWSAQLEKVRAEGTHLFFRWPGFWGAPKALRGAYVGNEPAFAKLAMLSPAHAVAASMMPPLSDIDVSGSLTAEMGYNSTAYVPGLTGEPLYPLPSDPNAAGFVPAGPAESVADDKARQTRAASPIWRSRRAARATIAKLWSGLIRSQRPKFFPSRTLIWQASPLAICATDSRALKNRSGIATSLTGPINGSVCAVVWGARQNR